MNASFLNILQSVFGCLVDYRLRNIHLNICGACQGDFREFHSVFSVILQPLLVNPFSCLVTYLVTQVCSYRNMEIKGTIECLTKLI